MNEARFIPGIYNYCDRWCERCPMTRRCQLYANEQEELTPSPKSQDPTNQAFWERMTAKLADTLQLLHEVAEEYGLDLDQLPEEAEPDHREEPSSVDCIQAARCYGAQASAWLEEKLPAIYEALADEVALQLMSSAERAQAIPEAVAVIQWYLHQIEVKLRRAYYSQSTAEEDEISSEDTNGSAKVALVGIERSLSAWRVLYDHLFDEQDDVLDHLVRLECTHQLTLRQFPGAPHFVRPGFDD